MAEPISIGGLAVKGLMSAAPMTIKAVSQEWARRRADLSDLDPATLAPEMDEALNVLLRADDSILKGAANNIKALLSDVPKIFETPLVRSALGSEPLRAAIKAASLAVILDGRAPEDRHVALEDVATQDGQREALIVAFDYAIAFVCQTLITKLTPGERVVISKMEKLQASVDGLSGQGGAAASASLSRELLDQRAQESITRLTQRRLFPECALAVEAKVLAEQLTGGNLSGASDGVRADGLARCARWLSRGEHSGLAPDVLAQAKRLGAGEIAMIAEAFIASQSELDSGLSALAPIDTPAKRSAALTLVGHARTPAEVLTWVAKAGITPTNLDAEGRGNLALYAMLADAWDDARAHADQLTDADFAAAPRSLHLAAMAQLAPALSPDTREVLLGEIPLQAGDFPLKDNPENLAQRTLARALFARAAEALKGLGLPTAARISNGFALWLGLRDSSTHAQALADLTTLVRQGREDISYLPLALVFDAPVDRAKIDRALDQREALDPDGSVEVAMARFAMANTSPSPGEALVYLREHRDGMAKFLLPEVLASMEVQLLVAMGESDQAQARLDAAQDVPEALRIKLQDQIGAGSSGPSLETLEAWYAETPTIFNLRPLVERLSRQGFSERWFTLARELVQQTAALPEAEAVVGFLIAVGRTQELDAILGDVDSLVPASLVLRSAKAWSRYRAGDVQQAEQLVTALRAERDERNDRGLFLNLIIATGRWDELPPFIEQEWLKREARDAEELVQLAQLANRIGSSRASAFAKLAAEAAPADPDVLVNAYQACSEAGVEDATSAGWIMQAHALSGEDGPVTTGSIAEILGQTDDWNRHVEDIWAKIRAGALPLSLAAKALRRTWLDMQLTPMVLNPSERDPRRRSVTPLFSGARPEQDIVPTALALDGSTIVTLSVLGVLETVIAKPLPIYIPQATLSWMFAERHRLRFHQPSQIARAEALVRDISAGRLSVFAPTAPPPPSLVDEVGRDLAEMIAAAHAAGEPGQMLVVRPGPIQKLGTFLDEEADVSAYPRVLISCSQLVDKLVEATVLTSAEESEARGYLASQGEARWPDAPEIADDAVLLLDDLAISYLRTTKILDRLHMSGFDAQVSARRRDEANAYAQLKTHTGQIEDKIEAIRATLAGGIAAGAVRLGSEVTSERDVMQHPNVAVIKLASKVDIVVSDERFVNRTLQMVNDGERAAVWSSLDIIDWLVREGDIDFERFLTLRTSLRRSGAIFVSPTAEELTALVARATVRDQVVRETMELKAFRENVLMAQMGGWLQLPLEAPFLQNLHHAIAEAILAQWEQGEDLVESAARSTWLLNAYDPRNWASGPEDAEPNFLARFGQAQLFGRLALGGPSRAVRRIPDGLDSWLETAVVAPMREHDPQAYSWMIAYMRGLVEQTDTAGTDDDG